MSTLIDLTERNDNHIIVMRSAEV